MPVFLIWITFRYISYLTLKNHEKPTLKNDSSTVKDPKQTTMWMVMQSCSSIHWIGLQVILQDSINLQDPLNVGLSFQQKIAQVESGVNSGTQRQCLTHLCTPSGQLDLTKSFYLQSKIAICPLEILWSVQQKFGNPMMERPQKVFPSRVSGLYLLGPRFLVFSSYGPSLTHSVQVEL